MAEADERVDRRVVAIAARQHGVVTTRQLRAAGLDDGATRRRVARGWMLRLHRGVYLVGPLEAPLTRVAAAVLACGPGAHASHQTAAALWDLADLPSALDVTVHRQRRPHAGVRVHQSSLRRDGAAAAKASR